MDISIHDNHLISYCVLSNAKEIHLHTSFRHLGTPEYTDVVFTDVVAYQFEYDSFGTILFDIVEVDPASIYNGDKARFLDGAKYGWPGPWRNDEQALDYLSQHGVKGFELQSSCGMSGWVLAQSMSKTAVSAY